VAVVAVQTVVVLLLVLVDQAVVVRVEQLHKVTDTLHRVLPTQVVVVVAHQVKRFLAVLVLAVAV
jgi:hypothetical protein